MQSLRDLMEYDHVIRVTADGTIETEVPSVYAPEVHLTAPRDEHGDMHVSDADERDMIAHLKLQGWDVLTGWSSQYMYRGPVMHESEFIGGRLAEHIQETPGLYVKLAVDAWPEDDDTNPEYVGWIIAFREEM